MKKFSKSKSYKKFRKHSLDEKMFFEANGLTGEKLEEILKLTNEQFIGDNKFNRYNVSLDLYVQDMEDDGKSPLLKSNIDKLTYNMNISDASYFAWINDVNDENLVAVLNEFSEIDLKILTEIVIKNNTINKTAELIGYSRQWTSVKYKKIIEKLRRELHRKK